MLGVARVGGVECGHGDTGRVAKRARACFMMRGGFLFLGRQLGFVWSAS